MAVKDDRQSLRDDMYMFDFFKALPSGDREQLLPVVEQVSRAQGEIFFHQGDLPGDCFLITAGQVGIFTSGAADEVAAESGNDGEEVDPLGGLDSTLGPGKPVGFLALMQDKPRSASARCLEDCKLIIIKKNDFNRIVKDPLSRDLVEKQSFLESHLPGLREFSAKFVPVTGKPIAAYMFVKNRFGNGHVFYTEGSIAEDAIYVVFSGSVDFYRNAVQRKTPVLPGSETYLRQPSVGGRKKLCSMIPGGVFATSQVVASSSSPELFTVVAGSQGCEIFGCSAENIQKLSYKVLNPLQEHLQRTMKHRLDRFSSMTASEPLLLVSPKASPLSPMKRSQSTKASSLSPMKRSQSSTLSHMPPELETSPAAAAAGKGKRFARKMERIKVVMPKSTSMLQLLEISLSPAEEVQKGRHAKHRDKLAS